MSGSKRRSGYRKTVEASTLHGLPSLRAGDAVALIARGAGANLFEVVFDGGARSLAMLPSKFRKLVWLKRGDFVIVSGAAGATLTARGTAGAVTHAIEHILYADAVRHLKATAQWPDALERERDAVCAAGAEGARQDELGGAAAADGAHPSDVGVGDAASREQPAARRLQGLRGLPPPADDDEGEEEGKGEDGEGDGSEGEGGEGEGGEGDGGGCEGDGGGGESAPR